MMKNRYLVQFVLAATLLLGSGALNAAQTLSGVIAFAPLYLKDSAGAKLEKAVLTYQNQAYEINLNGLGAGGASGIEVKVTGEVYGLANVTDLEDTFETDLGQAQGEVSSEDLWLYSARGVSIRLQIDNPEAAIAQGGDAVTVAFPEFDTSGHAQFK
jgi:hypothetical protein